MTDLDLADLLARFDRARGRDDFDGAPTERDGPVVRVDYPHGGFVATPGDTGLRGAGLDALIARQRDAFAARGLPVEGVVVRETSEPADFAAIGILHTEVWGEDWSWIAQDLSDRAGRVGSHGFGYLRPAASESRARRTARRSMFRPARRDGSRRCGGGDGAPPSRVGPA